MNSVRGRAYGLQAVIAHVAREMNQSSIAPEAREKAHVGRKSFQGPSRLLATIPLG
jgi:hypothetical protein